LFVSVTGVRYKVLNGAWDEASLGHLLQLVRVHPRDGEPFEAQPETTIEETSAALVELLRDGLVGLWDAAETPPLLLTLAEAEAIASDPANWSAPACWNYMTSTTSEGEAALIERDKQST
jgi:hypothetical protein